MQTMSMMPEEFIAPGIVQVSAAALQLARDFSESVGAAGHHGYVTTFDWAQSIGVRQKAGAPLQEMGACLMLSAYQRGEVPTACIQCADRLVFAIRIPKGVWRRSVRRLIDVDDSLPFGLALR